MRIPGRTGRRRRPAARRSRRLARPFRVRRGRQAGNGAELLALVRSVRPELAIIDIRMPPAHATEGLHAARVLREELPGTAIIVVSAHVEVDEAMELLAGGERLGYLLKSRATDVTEFIDTVERITAGASAS